MNASIPENGNVRHPVTTYQSQAIYSCNVGYDLTPGDGFRECLADGTWSGPDPTCEGMLCLKGTGKVKC